MVSAYIVEVDFVVVALDLASPERTAELEGALQIDEEFEVVGIGGAEADGDAVMVVVYIFDDEGAAESATSGIEDAWSSESRPGHR